MGSEVYWDANTKRVIYRTWDGLVYLKYVSQSPLSIQIKNIAAGGADSMAIDHYGRMWGWGYNLAGEIGNYSTFSEVTPVSIHGNNKTFCMVQGSQFRAMGLEYNGMIWGWGLNGSGQFGNFSTNYQCTPVSVHGNKKTFINISTGDYHTLAIDNHNQTWAWGQNAAGELGNNDNIDQCTPVSIHGYKKTFCKISGGGGHSIGLDKNDNVWTWGYNIKGELGNNSTNCEITPVSLYGDKNFVEISAGQFFCLAIDQDGKVWGWGYNNFSQLGDNTQTDQSTPIAVYNNGVNYCKIAAGTDFSLGIDDTGLVWGWGRNEWGQLGNDDQTEQATPVSIHGNRKTFCEISPGTYFVLALDNNNQLWAWGYNSQGQLGNNDTSLQKTPVRVCNIIF